MLEKKPRIVILSRNYSTGLSVIRSLGNAGYDVDLIASAFKNKNSILAASSKFVQNSVEVVSRKVKDGGDEELVQAMLDYASEHDEPLVLFPTDDYTTSIMDQNRTILEKYYKMPTIIGGGNGCLTERMDKMVQSALAKEAGLLVPEEWVIPLDNEIEIPEDVIYPCFCKPMESVTGFKREMKKCFNKRELEKHLRKMKRRFENRSVLVQEFLEIDNEIDISGVCLDQEIIIPAIIRKREVAQYKKGVTLSGEIVPFEELGELQDTLKKLLKSFHYFGMFDMELNIVGDKYYFNEVNLRSGGPNYSYFKSGVNLPELFVKEALGLGHTEEDERVTEYGKTFVYENVAWEDYIHGFMTKEELDLQLEQADITLLNDDDDPAPGRIFLRDIKKEEQAYKEKLQKKEERKAREDEKKAAEKKAEKKKAAKKKAAEKKAEEERNAALAEAEDTSRVKEFLLGYPQAKKKNQRQQNQEKARVLVTGRNYCSNLTMARSLGQAGYDVEVLRIFQKKPPKNNLMKAIKADAYSEYIKAYHVCVSNRNPDIIVDRLKAMADLDNKMLLIPADDLMAAIVDEYLEELEEYYYLPNVEHKPDEINRLMRKDVQKELAGEAGLPIINSCVIKAKKGKFKIPETVTYPCFIKPNVSKNSAKSRMRKCETEEELRAALTQFSRKKPIEMLVEDYVEIGKEYSLLGVSTPEGVCAPGFFVAEEGGQMEHRGVALLGRILPCEQEQELIDKLVLFMESLNYEGLFDIDLIETVDGKMYFVEVNLRFGASGYAVTECGVNLPGMFADYVLANKPIDTTRTLKETGKRFVSEKILIEEYAMGRISRAKMKEVLNRADIRFVDNATDKAANRHFKKFYLAAAWNRLSARATETIEARKTQKNLENAKKEAELKLLQENKNKIAWNYPQTKPENQRGVAGSSPRVVVAGYDYSANLAVAKALEQGNYDVEVLRVLDNYPEGEDVPKGIRLDAYHKNIKAFHVCVTEKRRSAIAQMLVNIADPNQKMLLIPTDGLTAKAIERNRNFLSNHYIMQHADALECEEQDALFSDEQRKLALKVGVPVARCFVKKVKGEMAIEEHLETTTTLLKQDGLMLTEKAIEVSDNYTLLGLSTKDGVTIPGYFVEVKPNYENCKGRKMLYRALSCEENTALLDLLKAFVGTLEYEGLFAIELVKRIDGKVYFKRFTPKGDALMYALAENGVNLPAMYADYMLDGTSIDLDVKATCVDNITLNEKLMLVLLDSGKLSREEAEKTMTEADICTIKNENDELSYKHFMSCVNSAAEK